MRVLREVRFSLAPADRAMEKTMSAAWAPHLSLRALVGGPVDSRTGYLVDVSRIDRVLRDTTVPMLQRCLASTGGHPLPPAAHMRPLWTAAAEQLGDFTLEELELRTSDHLRFAISAGDLSMVTMTRCFDFAAAHRLYVPDLSSEENFRIFGKCANPAGHGHNYVLDVTVIGEPDSVSGTIIDLPAFDAIVKEHVLDRFDHKHLNADCAEFAELNPSMENIARVIWNLLVGAFERCRLRAVRVWETPRSCAEFRGE